MATSMAPLLAVLCLSLLALVASGMLGMHLLPPWMQAQLARLRGFRRTTHQDNTDLDGPDSVLIHQLEAIDAMREPKRAYQLHSAIGKVLRSSGTQGTRALHHLEAARDAAVRGGDPDAVMSAHLDLAEAYIEQGHALDSQHELVVASAVMPNHFAEHSVNLNRGRGRAKFELGHIVTALQYFEQAARTASKPEDVVRIVCDSAMAQTCLGHAHNAIEPLHWAVEVLQEAKQQGPDAGLPDDLYYTLAAEVHLRLAEALHYLASASSSNAEMVSSAESAEAHYKKALHLQQKSSTSKPLLVSAIEKGLARLRQSLTEDLQGVLKPLLHCPSKPSAPWEPTEPTNVKAPDFTVRINELWAKHKYDLAVSELKATLRAHPRPYRNLQAAIALNMLGETFLRQGSFSSSAKNFRQALHAIIMSGEAKGDKVEAGKAYAIAYKGLMQVKDRLPLAEQEVAAAALDQYHERALKLAITKDEPIQKGKDSLSSAGQGVAGTPPDQEDATALAANEEHHHHAILL